MDMYEETYYVEKAIVDAIRKIEKLPEKYEYGRVIEKLEEAIVMFVRGKIIHIEYDKDMKAESE